MCAREPFSVGEREERAGLILNFDRRFVCLRRERKEGRARGESREEKNGEETAVALFSPGAIVYMHDVSV